MALLLVDDCLQAGKKDREKMSVVLAGVRTEYEELTATQQRLQARLDKATADADAARFAAVLFAVFAVVLTKTIHQTQVSAKRTVDAQERALKRVLDRERPDMVAPTPRDAGVGSSSSGESDDKPSPKANNNHTANHNHETPHELRNVHAASDALPLGASNDSVGKSSSSDDSESSTEEVDASGAPPLPPTSVTAATSSSPPLSPARSPPPMEGSSRPHHRRRSSNETNNATPPALPPDDMSVDASPRLGRAGIFFFFFWFWFARSLTARCRPLAAESLAAAPRHCHQRRRG